MSQTSETDYLSVDDALKRILDVAQPMAETERVTSKKSDNRVLAADHRAQRDIPAFDNSAMDGYLFLTEDLDTGKRKFKIEGEIRPEDDTPAGPEPNTCVEIMTGAPVPAGDYTVVPVEMTEQHGKEVLVNDLPVRNPVRKRGEGYKNGKVVLKKGTVIRPYEIGLLIESGNFDCSVIKNIRIGVQVTGSEIDESRNSNGPVLNRLVRLWPGTEVVEWPVLEDDLKKVKDRMLKLKESSDVVLTTGGISMGKHDYVLSAMKKLGAEIIIRKVQQKPGKPLTVTKLDNTLFFHLPGNPISSIFTAEYYVRQATHRMLGLKWEERSVPVAESLDNPRQDKTLFVPGNLILDHQNRLTVTSEGVMKSHLMQLYRDSDVYIRLNPETSISAGESVTVIPYSTTRLP